MRGEQHRGAGAAETIERGQRPSTHQGVLRGERLIDGQNRGGCEIQRFSKRDVPPFRRRNDLPILRLRQAAREFQQFRDARIFFPDDADDDPRGRDSGEIR